MKKKIAVLSAMLLLLGLTGCNNSTAKNNLLEPFAFSKSNENIFRQDALPAAEETSEAELESGCGQSEEDSGQEKTAANETATEQKAEETSTEKSGNTTEPPKNITQQEITEQSENKPAEETTPDNKEPDEELPKPEPVQVPDSSEVEAKVAAYINQYRPTYATVLSGLTNVARYRSRQLVTNFSHSDGTDVCNALQYGEFVDMTLYGMSENDSYYQGYNREAIAKGNWTGTSDEIAKNIADGYRNSSSHWSYLGSSEYPYIAVGCTYDSATSTWYCCICISSQNYGG